MNPLTWAQSKGYIGKQVPDPNGGYLGECVSLWKDYHVDVNKISYADLYVPGGAAKNIWLQTTTALLKHFDKFSSGPAVGDSIIYNGTYGDVALYIGNGQVIGQLGTPVFQPVEVRPIGAYMGILRLKENNMDAQADATDIDRLYLGMLGRAPSADEVRVHTGTRLKDLIRIIIESPERTAYALEVEAALAGPPDATQLKPGLYKV